MESEKNMEHKIVFATSNAGKMREIREILKDLGAEILSMKEAGVDVGRRPVGSFSRMIPGL